MLPYVYLANTAAPQKSAARPTPMSDKSTKKARPAQTMPRNRQQPETMDARMTYP